MGDDSETLERYRKFKKHGRKCEDCNTWSLKQELKRRGVKIKNHPCLHLADYSTTVCATHPDPWHCPDRAIIQLSSGEYVIPIRDGGHAGWSIQNCPWCGQKIEKPQAK